MRKLSLVVLLLVVLLAVPFATADTLTFNSGTGPVEGYGYTYPYNFTLNNTLNIDLMCLSYDQEIWQGESWQVTPMSLAAYASYSSTPSINAFEAAWLFTDAQTQYAEGNSNTSALDNLAAWGVYADDAPITGGSNAQLALALAGYSSLDLEDFVIYVPIDGTQPEGDPYPQIFIGDAPEPISLILFGSGLAGLAGTLRRRIQKGV